MQRGGGDVEHGCSCPHLRHQLLLQAPSSYSFRSDVAYSVDGAFDVAAHVVVGFGIDLNDVVDNTVVVVNQSLETLR